MTTHHYDVAFTFAGEDRDKVSPIAHDLRQKGYTVFYDEFEAADLWGRNLVDYLHELYYARARFCVIFVSSAYIRKAWANLERRAAQARAFSQWDETYILPIHIDGTSLPGLPQTVAYIEMSLGPEKISDLLAQQLGPHTNI